MALFLLTAQCLPRGHTRQPREWHCPAHLGLQLLWAAGRIWHPDPAKATGHSCSESIKARYKHWPNLHWAQNTQGLTPSIPQPKCWMVQGTAGNLTPVTTSWCASSFIPPSSPLKWGNEQLFFPQSLGTSMDTLTWLIHLSLLYLLKEQMGKLPLWIFLNNTRDICDGTYCPWKTEVEPALWNREDPPHHYEELPQNFFKPQCLCSLFIQSEQ